MAFAAVAAAVAYHAATAFEARIPVMGLIQVLLFDLKSERIAEMKLHRAPLVVYSGLQSHFRLDLLVGKVIHPTVFDESVTGFDETEPHIMALALRRK